MLEVLNRKYSSEITLDLLNPTENPCYRGRPAWVVSLTEDDFHRLPTRWSLRP
jgi:hypothetical protein